LQSFRGKLFKIRLLAVLPTTTIRVKSLEKSDSGCIDLVELGPFNANSTKISATSAIQNELMLHIPESSTYEAIDAVLVVPDAHQVIYVQSTVSHKHPIKYKYLKDVYNTLMKKPGFQVYTHMLLFIIPDDFFDPISCSLTRMQMESKIAQQELAFP